MNAMTRIGGFGLALAVLFGVSYVVGTTIGSSEDAAGQAGGQEISAAAGGGSGAPAPGGLAVSAGGYTLAPDQTTWSVGRSAPYTFRVLGPDGHPVKSFTRAHDADLHLIVVRRDLTGYQHLHPTRDAAGTWSVPLRLGAAGVYRVFADFIPANSTPAAAAPGTADDIRARPVSAGGSVNPITLGVDLTAGGDLRPVALPTPARTAIAPGGYIVSLTGRPELGGTSTLGFTVTRNGRPVRDLETYLGALGHLVAIRQGDLAYLHVHPSAAHGGGAGHGAAGSEAAGDGDSLAFATQFPSVGSYRLYLDFKHEGQVRTAEFTLAVTGERTAPTTRPTASTPPAAPSPAHVH